MTSWTSSSFPTPCHGHTLDFVISQGNEPCVHSLTTAPPVPTASLLSRLLLASGPPWAPPSLLLLPCLPLPGPACLTPPVCFSHICTWARSGESSTTLQPGASVNSYPPHGQLSTFPAALLGGYLSSIYLPGKDPSWKERGKGLSNRKEQLVHCSE